MTRQQKLLENIRRGSRNIRFDDLTALMESFGFQLKRISGSHHIYRHPDVPQTVSVQPGRNNQAKPYQIKQFLKLVEEYNLQLEDDSEDDEPEDDES